MTSNFRQLQPLLARSRVSTQLYVSFGLMILLCLAVGAIGLVSMSRMGKENQVLHDKWLGNVGRLSALRTAMVETRAFDVKHSRTDDRSYHSEYEEKLQVVRSEASQALEGYRAQLAADTDESKLFETLTTAWTAYEAALNKVLALGKAKQQADAADISDGAALMAYDEALEALAKLLEFNFNGGLLSNTLSADVQRQAQIQTASVTAVALLAALVLATLITTSLLRQLGGEPRAAAEVVSAVAQGDLTVQVSLGRGDTASLMASLERMKQSLLEAVARVRSGAENVAASSSQIAQGNQDLSQRTEQQASALQETASNLQELSSTVRNNAEHAAHAKTLANGASQVATQGGTMVLDVVATMKGIDESSRRIADIIGVIDGIAFQTNILALNAAVEAARAGEQGRGFAVVASEVRSLAQRSAGAAREIKQLITASVDRTAQGSAQVERAGRTMNDIVLAIQQVSDAVGEISLASQQQSSGVAQVEQAVAQMDQSTRQNAALVEQSAASAQALRAQANELLESVAVFQTEPADSRATDTYAA